MTFLPPADPPGTLIRIAGPLSLDGGAVLRDIPVAYESYGRLDAARGNAILVCHALSGDQVLAGPHPVTGRPGWWDLWVGPGKPIDTDRYFVVCANVLGGCMGTLGPASIDPQTGRPFGPDFPALTVADMVRAQALLLDRLGIDRLALVIGGSMGGMQALNWLADQPERVAAVACIAACARHSAQQIALNGIGRQAIMSDPAWQGGRYCETGPAPEAGLATARMLAHLSYRSPAEIEERFGRRRQPGVQDRSGAPVYQVENYLAYHGRRFLDRFDAGSYMAITRAMDAFDLAPDGDLAARFASPSKPVFLAAFDSDWLYPAAQSAELAEALAAAGHRVAYQVHAALQGHDSFLLAVPSLQAALKTFLAENAAGRGRGR